MAASSIIAAIDIGTTKVCAIVAEKNKNNELEIIGIGSHPSHGLKKGAVVNIDKTIRSIHSAVNEAKLMSGVEISSASIGIAGSHIYSFNSSGVVPIKNKEITDEDVEKVIDAAKAVVLPSDREILHVIPQEYKVDNTSGIKNPVGMCGVRLEVHVHIVTGAVSLIQNLVKCVESSGIITNKVILQPIASSNSVISHEEKDLGVVLVDIGGGTTDIAVWKNGGIIFSHIIPVGGSHFTNDLAVALKIPHKEAERVKINHGSALSENINPSSHITVKGMEGTKSREISLRFIAEVLGARSEELFGIIKKLLEEKDIKDCFTGGFIITGGGSLLKDLAVLAEYTLDMPVKLGYPKAMGGMTNIMQNPQYSTVLGLLQESKYIDEDQNLYVQHEEGDLMSKLGNSIKNVFREIF